MSDFYVQCEQWHTADKFREHLAKHSPLVAPWVEGVVIHHTWRPEVRHWRGRTTFDGIVNYYKAKVPKWNSAPHLFIVDGSPDPKNDGIWQMTPLNIMGTHAGAWNRTHWGIEVVGNYDASHWTPRTKELVYDAVLILFAWRNIQVTRQSVVGHRETGSRKSCPGKLINMNTVRSELQQRQGGNRNVTK